MVRAFSTVAPPGPAAPTVTLPAVRAQGTRTGSSDHPAFDAFIAEIFGRLPRADQRRWARVYTRGLLMTPGRKTVRRLAAAASDSATAAQALHQFVNASPWEWEPIRARLADWVVTRSAPRALVVATTVLPKRGDRSCGVHRRFVPQEGRTVNCQVGIGAFLAAGRATVPVDWRLLLPGPWSADPQVRDRARIPEDATGHQDSPGAQALDLIDRSGPSPHGGGADPDGLPVVADLLGFADTAELAGRLVARRRGFVLAAPADLLVHPDRATSGVPGTRPGAVLTLPRQRTGLPARDLFASHAHQSAAVAAVPVRLPGVSVPLRLLGERRPDGSGGDRFWLTDLVDRPAREVLALARLHTAATDTTERLAADFGLRAFEGRSYPGWHHHMTLVSAAFAYGSLGRTGTPPAHASRGSRGPQPARPPRRARTSTTPTRTGCS